MGLNIQIDEETLILRAEFIEVSYKPVPQLKKTCGERSSALEKQTFSNWLVLQKFKLILSLQCNRN